MTKKEENQRKSIRELLKGISYRNHRILRLLEENRELRKNNFELYCALNALSPKSVTMHPYEGYTDPYIIKILEANGIEWKR